MRCFFRGQHDDWATSFWKVTVTTGKVSLQRMFLRATQLLPVNKSRLPMRSEDFASILWAVYLNTEVKATGIWCRYCGTSESPRGLYDGRDRSESVGYWLKMGWMPSSPVPYGWRSWESWHEWNHVVHNPVIVGLKNGLRISRFWVFQDDHDGLFCWKPLQQQFWRQLSLTMRQEAKWSRQKVG